MVRLIRVRSQIVDGITTYVLSEYTGMRKGRDWYAANGVVVSDSMLPLSKLKYDGTAIIPKTSEELAADAAAEEKAYFDGLYVMNTDGALAVRVREYKALIDQLGMTYDATIPELQQRIMADTTLTTEQKLIQGEYLKGTFDGVMLNLESIGFATSRWDAWRLMEKLIEYLPPADASQEV